MNSVPALAVVTSNRSICSQVQLKVAEAGVFPGLHLCVISQTNMNSKE